MSNDELLARIDAEIDKRKRIYGTIGTRSPEIPRVLTDYHNTGISFLLALRAVVELHKPEYWENIHDPNWNGNECSICFTDGNLEIPSVRIDYPCPTIQAITDSLK